MMMMMNPQATLERQLSEDHGIILEYNTKVVKRDQLRASCSLYGVVTTSHAYTRRGTSATDAEILVIYLAEPESTMRAYLMLRAVSQCRPDAVAKVGWIHDDGEAHLAQVDHLQRVMEASTSTTHAAAPSPTDATTSCGYLMLLWALCPSLKSATAEMSSTTMHREAVRAEVQAQLLHGQASGVGLMEWYEDDEEGGRIFLRYNSYDAAEDCRRALVHKFDVLERAISYGDADDYARAHKKRMRREAATA